MTKKATSSEDQAKEDNQIDNELLSHQNDEDHEDDYVEDDEHQEDIESGDEHDEQEQEEEQEEIEGFILQEDKTENGAAPEWIKALRQRNREYARRERERERLDKESQIRSQSLPVLGPKPTLDGCDFDAEKYERDLEAWHEKKLQIDQDLKKKEAAQNAERESWNKRLQEYEQRKSKLKVKDFDEAELAVEEALSVTQQGILLNGSTSPEKLVYALGKRAKDLHELSLIQDPIKFAFAISKMEDKLTSQVRKPETKPEKKMTGSSASSSASIDSTLDKLRKEAERTGDYTKVYRYKREKSAA